MISGLDFNLARTPVAQNKTCRLVLTGVARIVQDTNELGPGEAGTVAVKDTNVVIATRNRTLTSWAVEAQTGRS